MLGDGDQGGYQTSIEITGIEIATSSEHVSELRQAAGRECCELTGCRACDWKEDKYAGFVDTRLQQRLALADLLLRRNGGGGGGEGGAGGAGGDRAAAAWREVQETEEDLCPWSEVSALPALTSLSKQRPHAGAGTHR